ncbi:hypothetical protein C8R42DRAFT_549219, partial [Lentinula raphanica]
LSWGLFATSHALHPFHVDCEGYGTWVMPHTGSKYWVIAIPRQESDFASTEMFGSRFRVDGHNSQRWGFYGFILEPGDMLVMPPCTPHFVLTPSPTICHGGHYYSYLTMARTAYSWYHNFVAASTITNTTDYNAFDGLMSIMSLWHHSIIDNSETYLESIQKLNMDPAGAKSDDVHLPNFYSFEDIIQFLTLVNLVKMIPVLDVRRYREKS